MKKLFFTFFFFVVFITAYSQINRANTKKSIPYSANYQRMDAGGKATLEIRDGTLWAWGYNFYGQLGNGTYDNDSIPKQIGVDNNWVSISVGDAHNLGLKSDGSLWAWGYNNEGQLGDSTTASKNIPVQIGTDNNWVSINAGYYHSLGLKSDGTLWSWGSNSYGQLGDGTIINKNKPLKIGVDSNWVSISAGLYHSFALKSDGTLWAWGYNFYGQLGDGTNTDKSSPLQIGTDSTWVIITAGEASTFGLKSDGTLWAWGMNSNGQLGDGTIINKNSPVQIGVANNWVSITSGIYHTVGLKSDGTLWAWGDNSSGQLGDGTTTASNSPIQIGTDNSWVAVTVGSDHTLGLKSDGTLWAWGYNYFGQLGNNSTVSKSNPIQTSVVLNGWLSITAGEYHTLGLKLDGTLWAWGGNDYGQLGDSTTVNKNVSVQIGVDNKWITIIAESNHTLGLKSDGTLWAWGNNFYGQLGDGTTVNKSSPIQIGTDNNWVTIAAGSYHALGLKSDGTLWAWGDNSQGQLGDGTTVDKSSPVQIGADNNWVTITAGYLHTFGLKSDGTLWAWGYNFYGQLGDGTTVNKNNPLQTGADNNWVTITAGDYHTLGLKSDGTLWAWGYNVEGQLGDGTTVNKSSPVQIGADNNWVTIAAGDNHALGLKSDRAQFCATGYNFYGQLGKGDTTNSNVFICSTNPPPCNTTLITSQSNVSCFGESNGSASVSAIGGTSPYNYKWSNGATTSSVSGLPASVYYITVTDVYSCQADTVIAITEPTDLTISLSQINVSCFGETNGSASVSASNGTSPYSYNWNIGGTTQNIASLSAGTYYITVTDFYSCQTDTLIVITEPDDLSITFSQTNASCFGESDGLSSVSVQGGTSPYSFKWSNGDTTQNISVLPAGTYYATVSDVNNCTKIDSITITEPPFLATYTDTVAKILHDGINCIDYPIIKIGSQWWTTKNIYAAKYADGAYMTDGTGAGDISTDFTTKYYFHYKDSVSYESKYGKLYTWAAVMNGEASSDSIPSGIQGVCPSGWHVPSDVEWIQLEIFLGMSQADANKVGGARGFNEGSKLKETSTTNWASPNSDATNETGFTAIPGGFRNNNGTFDIAKYYAYFWLATDSNSTNAWHRFLTYSNANVGRDVFYKNSGFSVRCTKEADLLNSLTISISDSSHVSCNGLSDGSANVTVTGGTSPYTFLWNTGAQTQNITSLAAGIYFVTVTDAVNNKVFTNVTISQPSPIVIVLSKTESACEGTTNGTASVSVYGGTPGYSYLWSTGATTTSINGLSVGNYFVKATDASSCKSSKLFHIYCDLVWPGDINGDLRANHYDLLSLGMIYEQTGTLRDSVDIKFEGKESLDWPGFFKSGINKKHADCNGDGIVNKLDAIAIKKNFGKSHGKSSIMPKQYNSSNPDLYFEILEDDVAPGSSVEVSIMIGRDTISLYGIGFEIKIDLNLIDPSTMQLTWNNSWLGTEDVDMLTFDTLNVSTGDIFAACVRTDFNINNSYGEVARMKFNIRSDTTITDTTKLNMFITSDKGGFTTSDGDSVVFNDSQDTLNINPTSIRENLLTQSTFKIYPNPTDGTIQLNFDKIVNIETVSIFNELGQVVYEENKKSNYKNNYQLQLPDLENGIYSIQIKTSDFIYFNQITYLKK